MECRSFYKIKLKSIKLPRSVFSRLEISMVLMEFFVVPFKWSGLAVVSRNGLPVVFLVGLLTLSNVYEKVKIFEIIKSRKPTANIDDPFDLK